MKIGVITGGGDCPGLNAAVRAVVRSLKATNHTVLGILGGWDGLVNMRALELDNNSVSGILPKGGTILGTSRSNPFKNKKTAQQVARNISNLALDGLVVIGGYDTLGVAAKLHKEEKLPIVGVPKTIDRDVPGTEFTIGFDTACTVATEAIDRLHTTAESHNRVMIVEVMGRTAGWIALESGIAGGADVIVIPEFPQTVQEIGNMLVRRHNRGKDFSIIVVSDGAQILEEAKGKGKPKGELITRSDEKDEFGNMKLGGIAYVLANRLQKLVGFDIRVSSLGHVQRGGNPTARDRYLATRLGLAASDFVNQKKFGTYAAIREGRIVDAPLADVLQDRNQVDKKTWDMVSQLLG